MPDHRNPPFIDHIHHVKTHLQRDMPEPDIGIGCGYQEPLLGPVNSLFGHLQHRRRPGLDLHHNQVIPVAGNDIDLLMDKPPVGFQYDIPLLLKLFSRELLTGLPEILRCCQFFILLLSFPDLSIVNRQSSTINGL